MGLLSRYQRKKGFIQLLSLIETSPPEKRERFLCMIREEDPLWEMEIDRKMLTLEDIFLWNKEIHELIFTALPVLQLTALVGTLKSEWAEKIISSITPKEKRQIEDNLAEKKPTAGEFATSVEKLFIEIRKQEAEGSFKFERIAPHLAIADNIEEQLIAQSKKIEEKNSFSPQSQGPSKTTLTSSESSFKEISGSTIGNGPKGDAATKTRPEGKIVGSGSPKPEQKQSSALNVQSTLSQNKKENLKIDDINVLKKLVQSLQAENKMLKIEIERLQNLKSQGSEKKAA